MHIRVGAGDGLLDGRSVFCTFVSLSAIQSGRHTAKAEKEKARERRRAAPARREQGPARGSEKRIMGTESTRHLFSIPLARDS